MPKSAKAAKTVSLAEKARKCLRETELGKRHYKRADALLAEICAEMIAGDTVKLNEHDAVLLKDRLSDGKTQFFHGSYARRYELELVKA